VEQGRKAAPKAGTQEKAVQEAEAVRQLAQDSYASERFKLPKELYSDPSSTPRQKREAPLPDQINSSFFAFSICQPSQKEL